jgi:hypothetical protein
MIKLEIELGRGALSLEPHTLHCFPASPSYRSRDINFAQALKEDLSIISHGYLLQIQDLVIEYVGLILQRIENLA